MRVAGPWPAVRIRGQVAVWPPSTSTSAASGFPARARNRWHWLRDQTTDPSDWPTQLGRSDGIGVVRRLHVDRIPDRGYFAGLWIRRAISAPHYVEHFLLTPPFFVVTRLICTRSRFPLFGSFTAIDQKRAGAFRMSLSRQVATHRHARRRRQSSPSRRSSSCPSGSSILQTCALSRALRKCRRSLCASWPRRELRGYFFGPHASQTAGAAAKSAVRHPSKSWPS